MCAYLHKKIEFHTQLQFNGFGLSCPQKRIALMKATRATNAVNSHSPTRLTTDESATWTSISESPVLDSDSGALDPESRGLDLTHDSPISTPHLAN